MTYRPALTSLFDPGWLFVLAGLAMCAAIILVPAQHDLATLRAQLSAIEAEDALFASRLRAYSNFIDEMERGEPALLTRLAAAQLNLTPRDERPVVLASAPVMSVTDWIDGTVTPEPPAHRGPIDSILGDLTQGRYRLWLLGASILSIFVGLMLGPSTQRRRTAAIQDDPDNDNGDASGEAVTLLADPVAVIDLGHAVETDEQVLLDEVPEDIAVTQPKRETLAGDLADSAEVDCDEDEDVAEVECDAADLVDDDDTEDVEDEDEEYEDEDLEEDEDEDEFEDDDEDEDEDEDDSDDEPEEDDDEWEDDEDEDEYEDEDEEYEDEEDEEIDDDEVEDDEIEDDEIEDDDEDDWDEKDVADDGGDEAEEDEEYEYVYEYVDEEDAIAAEADGGHDLDHDEVITEKTASRPKTPAKTKRDRAAASAEIEVKVSDQPAANAKTLDAANSTSDSFTESLFDEVRTEESVPNKSSSASRRTPSRAKRSSGRKPRH